MKGAFLWAMLVFLFLPLAYAHQPRIAFDTNNTLDNPILIPEPEISKAYYGILDGSPDYYKVESSVPFELYVGITVPQLRDSRTDFVVEISSKNKTLYVLNGSSFNWTHFYEEFAGDDYLSGPEIDANVSAGTYYINVYNIDNVGKYSLATGSIESFPLQESFIDVFNLPRIKGEFFNKPWWTAFTSKIGIFLFIPIIVFLIIIAALVWLVRKYARKKRRKH